MQLPSVARSILNGGRTPVAAAEGQLDGGDDGERQARALLTPHCRSTNAGKDGPMNIRRPRRRRVSRCASREQLAIGHLRAIPAGQARPATGATVICQRLLAGSGCRAGRVGQAHRPEPSQATVRRQPRATPALCVKFATAPLRPPPPPPSSLCPPPTTISPRTFTPNPLDRQVLITPVDTLDVALRIPI